MNVSEAIQLKRAVRSFEDEPLPEEATLAILNAGRRAQSSKNMQAWHFIAIQVSRYTKSIIRHGHLCRSPGKGSSGRCHHHPAAGNSLQHHVRRRSGGRLYAAGCLGDGDRLLPGNYLRARKGAPTARFSCRAGDTHRAILWLPRRCGCPQPPASERREKTI